MAEAGNYSGALALAAMGNPYIYDRLVEAARHAFDVLGKCRCCLPDAAIDAGYDTAIDVMGTGLWAVRDELMRASREEKLAIVEAIARRAGLAAARAAIQAARVIN